MVAAVAAVVVVAVVVLGSDCSCLQSYVQRNSSCLALLVEFEPGDMPKWTKQDMYIKKIELQKRYLNIHRR